MLDCLQIPDTEAFSCVDKLIAMLYGALDEG